MLYRFYLSLGGRWSIYFVWNVSVSWNDIYIWKMLSCLKVRPSYEVISTNNWLLLFKTTVQEWATQWNRDASYGLCRLGKLLLYHFLAEVPSCGRHGNDEKKEWRRSDHVLIPPYKMVVATCSKYSKPHNKWKKYCYCYECRRWFKSQWWIFGWKHCRVNLR